jgi:hypothetical protein
MKLSYSLALTLPLASSWAMAADLSVQFELPAMKVAEYHKPYVAIWIENADKSVASNLAVLYDVKKKDNGGLKWIKDLRTWWRVGGKDVTLPMDGVSGATKAPGKHTMTFDGALDKLPDGDYKLVVEASREAGGREVVRVPFTLPATDKLAAKRSGKSELRAVAISAE